jgi:biotin-(acetyl-CoA carboxylase) ligase
MLPSIVEIATKSIGTTLNGFGLTSCYVKRPNDVYCRDRKIAGILADSVVSGEESTVYLGIGINVNNDTSKNISISSMATSVSLELGREIDLQEFTVSLLQSLDLAYDELISRSK